MDEFTPENFLSNEEAEEKVANSTEEISSSNTVADEVTVDKTTDESEYTEVRTDEVTNSEHVDEELVVVTNVKDAKKIESQSDKLDKLIETQQLLLERIDSLNSLFNAKIMHTEHEEKIVDQMHKELQKYKEDMYAQLVRPILLDVIEVRDSIMRMTAAYLSKPEGEQDIPNKIFSDYAYDLQDILEKNSVEIYRSKTGDTFTPIKQRVIKKVATDNESLHGKVAESLSCGYSYKGRTISAEKITVYYYEKTIQENENSEVIENG